MSETITSLQANTGADFDESACNDSSVAVTPDTPSRDGLKRHVTHNVTPKSASHAARQARYRERQKSKLLQAQQASNPAPVRLTEQQKHWMRLGKHFDGLTGWRAWLICVLAGLKWTK